MNNSLLLTLCIWLLLMVISITLNYYCGSTCAIWEWGINLLFIWFLNNDKLLFLLRTSLSRRIIFIWLNLTRILSYIGLINSYLNCLSIITYFLFYFLRITHNCIRGYRLTLMQWLGWRFLLKGWLTSRPGMLLLLTLLFNSSNILGWGV